MKGRALTRELSRDGADRWLRRCSRARLSLLCVAIIAQQATAFIACPASVAVHSRRAGLLVSFRKPAAFVEVAPGRRAARALSLQARLSAIQEWEGMVDRVVEDLKRGVSKYIFVREVDDETAAELRAAVLVAGRGYKRRSAPAEGAPAPTLQEVVDAVQGLVRDAVVEREALMDEEEWDKIVRGFGQASTVVNDEGEVKPANAPPLTIDEVVVQLGRLFPNAEPLELEEAARRGVTLEAATDLIMTSSVSLTRLSEKPEKKIGEMRTARSVIAEAPPVGGHTVLTTQPVNGGASAFGLYLDLTATQHPISVTEIRASSSAGLGAGDPKPLAVKLNLCATGSARGNEVDLRKWQEIGAADAVSLNIASWFDAQACVNVCVCVCVCVCVAARMSVSTRGRVVFSLGCGCAQASDDTTLTRAHASTRRATVRSLSTRRFGLSQARPWGCASTAQMSTGWRSECPATRPGSITTWRTKSLAAMPTTTKQMGALATATQSARSQTRMRACK